jgi:N-methylhydantoinase A/oxoprolinase/acetone carboxylase beta subunit
MSKHVLSVSPTRGARRLINIDNGSTLTDVCVVDGAALLHVKVLTTPHDLSECFFEGLRRASEKVYEHEDVAALVRGAGVIRYSTTQGTNALVERKGPRLGLLVDVEDAARGLGASGREILAALVADRITAVDPNLGEAALEHALVGAVNDLTARGANRLVVSFSGPGFAARERRAEAILLARFPLHFLGSVPILFSREVADDADSPRRTWSALFNSFLHPTMEEFLYAADRRLRRHRISTPLLVFRNDGGSARIAKTIALKTYSSGPRAGMEGVRALARHYALEDLLSVDIGGTTTDVGRVRAGEIRSRRRGRVENVDVSLALAEIASFGVGGSSVVRPRDGKIAIGPDSVGSIPGPACFGRGGQEATMTDAFLLMGLLDPATFFGGGLRLDGERSRRAVAARVAAPLSLPLDQALLEMESAWVGSIADGIRLQLPVSEGTVIAAFGGAGALAICAVAERLGVRRILVPGLAAVWSAVGMGFSDLSQEYELAVEDLAAASLEATRIELLRRAERDMFGERVALSDCSLETSFVTTSGETETALPWEPGTPPPAGIAGMREIALRLRVVKPLDHPPLAPLGGERSRPAVAVGTRRILLDGGWRDVAVYPVEAQAPGAAAEGPAIFEDRYFTGKLLPGWRFSMTANRDLLLSRQ